MVENRPYRDFFAHAVLITGVLLVAFPLWVTFVASTLTFEQIVDVPMLADTTGSSGDTLAAVRIEPVGRLWPMIPVGSQVDVVSLR